MNGDETPDRPTNLVDLMNELIAPPEPAPISLMPQTIGWPILALLLIGLITFVVWRLQRKRRAEAYRVAALTALDSAKGDAETVARILRQTALTAFPRTDVASLYGSDWLTFLDTTCPNASFQTGPGAALATAPYQQSTNLQDEAVAAVRHWIVHHSRTVAT